MPPIDPDTVLRAEANAIHPGRIYPDGSPVGHIPESVNGKECIGNCTAEARRRYACLVAASAAPRSRWA